MKKLSVIVPVYNVEGYLERCVTSLIRQTYKNIEIILVDDGSTDGSGVLCDKLAEIYAEKVFVKHKKNGGLSDARNYGIEFATGYYIAFVDSDDYVHHQAYELLIHKMEILEADIAEGEYVKVDDQWIGDTYWDGSVEIQTRNEALIQLMDWKHFDISVWNKVYKRELIQGIKFPYGKTHEDEFWTYKVLFKANKLIHLNLQVYYYQQNRNGSILNASFTAKNLHSTEALLERIEFMKTNEPKLVDKANEALVVHIFYHLCDFVLNEKRPLKEWKKYFNYYAELLEKLPNDILESYTKCSRRRKLKVNISKALIKVNPNLFRILFQKSQRYFVKKGR